MKLQAIKPGKKFSPRSVFEVKDLGGEKVAEMDIIPNVMIGTILKEIQGHHPLDLSEIARCFEKAYEVFLREEPDGLNLEDYTSYVHRVTGIPFGSVKKSVEELAENLLHLPRAILSEFPSGAAALHYGKPSSAGVFWVPKGNSLSVIAPGNNPLTHKGWLEALAAGYKVAVKPSQREPFTPYRLVRSLLQAGMPEDHILFIPGNHDIVDNMVSQADFALVYGNEATVNKYKGMDNVIVRGPGYSKVFWEGTCEMSSEQIKASIIDSVMSDGGMKCFNTSGIICEKANGAQMEQIFNTLLSKTCRGFFDLRGELPLFSKDGALAVAKYLEELVKTNGLERIAGEDREYFIELDGGVCAMRPFIVRIKQDPDPLLKFEMPFPAFWVYEFEERADFRLLQNSLTLTVFSGDSSIRERAVLDATIKKVITGADFTPKNHAMIPHDGYLLNRLFEAKAVI